MRQFIIVILLICAFSKSEAQINLVRNPSFEQYSFCPSIDDELNYCNYWMSLDSGWSPPDWSHEVNGGVPEYCNVCAPVGSASVPLNADFNHYPRTGNGLVVFRSFHDETDTAFGARDYTQGHLSKTLVRGHNYYVSFYTLAEPMAAFAQNHIDAYLDDGTIDTVNHAHGGWVQSQYTPQIVDSTIVSDTANWTKIEGTFTSNGTERLITIGNFTPNSRTGLRRLRDTSGASGYIYVFYLLDDVSVIDCSNIPFAGNDTLIRPGDSAFLGPHESLLPYTWYQLGNPIAIDSGGGILVRPTVTTKYVLKQDLCGKILYDTVVVHVWPDTPTSVPIWQLENLTLFPNPLISTLNIDGATGCDLRIYNMLGEVVFSKNGLNNRDDLDLRDLLPGIYSVEVMDKVTGFKVVRMVRKE